MSGSRAAFRAHEQYTCSGGQSGMITGSPGPTRYLIPTLHQRMSVHD
jgi:hypothetical protein